MARKHVEQDLGSPVALQLGPSRRWLKISLAAVVATVAIIALASIAILPPGVSPNNFAAELSDAFSSKDYETVIALAEKVKPNDPMFYDCYLLASRAATGLGDWRAAAKFLEPLASETDKRSLHASLMLGEIFRREGELSKAEEAYLHVIENDPTDFAARQRLAFLYDLTGRRWESVPHHITLFSQGQGGIEQLALIADSTRGIEQKDLVDQYRQDAPNDILVQLAIAQTYLGNGRESEALPILRSVVEQAPQLSSAQAALGQALITYSPNAYQGWLDNLSAVAKRHPAVLSTMANWALSQGNIKNAAKLFWQILDVSPENRDATYQLSRILAAGNHPSAAIFARRAQQQEQLRKLVDDAMLTKGQHEPTLTALVNLLSEMGREWESRAWLRLAATANPRSQNIGTLIRSKQTSLPPNSARTLDSHNLTKLADIESVIAELTDANKTESTPSRLPGQQTLASDLPVRFVRSSNGIDFVYNNGANPTTSGARMQEETGGGIGIIDFDQDAWPDIYLTQGNQWPAGQPTPSSNSKYSDQLYRNCSGQSFRIATSFAGLSETDFGQGVSIGDVDCDGFPDIYVANIGQNRLIRNNGDGTFSDLNLPKSESTRRWTTSCLVADLNNDSLPDLYDANYLAGDNVFTLICDGKACSPNVFQGSPNLCYINLGDGSFQLQEDPAPVHNSKSLGILAGRLTQNDEQLSLFIANDQVPNFLIRCESTPDSKRLTFVEQAVLKGVAFNNQGLSTAAMGIAAEDLNSDGSLDFHVTNFLGESNALYVQDESGFFMDIARIAGLQEPSFPYVSWGTQFLDANLDGLPDLVVTNGHVDDNRDIGELYRMPSQFFKSSKPLRFESVPAGDYFSEPHLGRGLAILDWNGDGLMDFIVSNINESAALVTNRTESAGNYLNIVLHGTTSNRDAIGTWVEVTTEKGRWRKQLVAGDGYQASNQRLLQFGLGESQEVSEVIVRWPSGRITTLGDADLNTTLRLVESRPNGHTNAGSNQR